jgi:hypothetical protein
VLCAREGGAVGVLRPEMRRVRCCNGLVSRIDDDGAGESKASGETQESELPAGIRLFVGVFDARYVAGKLAGDGSLRAIWLRGSRTGV